AVKELVENALDAGAKNIDIKLENNGMDLIEVRDDGYGVKRCDAKNMALPSYTSKISDYADLDKLTSYGFRGEALNALCQVATVTITTRTREDEYAMTYTLDNCGSVLVSRPSSLSRGTVVTAKRLFYNLPVRKQYLTSNKRRMGQELKQVENMIKCLAVVHPQLRVTFCHDKCLVWQKSACQNLRQSLMQVTSHFVTNQLEELSLTESELKVEMLIPKKAVRNIETLCQSSNDAMMIYINNRPIRYKKVEKMVLKYVSEYFPEQLPVHRYPVCLISIVISPSELDVNLEPNKTQVLLKEEDEVLSKIENVLATYYEITTQNSQKSDETDVSEILNTSSSSENNQTEPSDKNLDEDKPTASKRMRLDVSNPTLVNKQFAGAFNSSPLELDEPKKEEIIRHSQVQRSCDVPVTTDASVIPSDERTFIEANSVDNSNINIINANGGISNSGSCQNFNNKNSNLDNSILQNENYSILNLDNLRFDQNASNLENIPSNADPNKKNSNSGISGFNQNFSDKTSNSQNSEIQKLGNSTSKFFSSISSTTTETTLNDKIAEIIENAESCNKTNVPDILEPRTFESTKELRSGVNVFETENNNVSEDGANFNDKSDFPLPTIPEEAPKNGKLSMEKWSMGLLKTQKGNIMQGSTVLLPKATVDSFNNSYQSVSSQMGQKEQSAFTKFSRDERPKILKEFPSIAFTRVAELLVQRWRILPQEERMRYEQIAKQIDEKRKNKALELGVQKLDTFIKQLNVPKNKIGKNPIREEAKLQSESEVKIEKKPKRPKRNKQIFEISIDSLKDICLGTYTKP
ncbi:hypothetical protein L9F63_012925, partial [Diploptera punctata]